jgi:hypothetical protein
MRRTRAKPELIFWRRRGLVRLHPAFTTEIVEEAASEAIEEGNRYRVTTGSS